MDVVSDVFSAFRERIGTGNYSLTDILHNVDVMYAVGRLTDDEREELYAYARENAKPQYDCSTEIESLWGAVREIGCAGGRKPGETRRADRRMARV